MATPETAAAFFARRAEGATRADLAAWLDRVPSRPADEWEGYDR